ncbi:rCG49441 [Rattus norvegicus]|uniref:RCG49441 n=1 Tax=Rattus norvegicus TaxID=10116 RepID=A6J2E8_RAT|nr:rCG49441 [Rattus norvegicus]
MQIKWFSLMKESRQFNNVGNQRATSPGPEPLINFIKLAQISYFHQDLYCPKESGEQVTD